MAAFLVSGFPEEVQNARGEDNNRSRKRQRFYALSKYSFRSFAVHFVVEPAPHSQSRIQD